jgi:hypothetical protein
VILSFSETTVAKQRHDLRAGGAWIPEYGRNETQKQPAELAAGDKNTDTMHSKYQREMSTSSWKHPDWTLSSQIIGESVTSRCAMHTVQLKEQDGSTSSVVKDWIFLEGQDQVVVAIVDIKGQWIVQRQQRYAIPGGPVLTPVQGMLISSDKESPFDAAQRIVLQQTGLTTNAQKQTESLPNGGLLDELGLQDGKVPDKFQRDWTFLGRYRNLGDQGGGFTYSYLLQNAVPGAEKGGTIDFYPLLNNLRERPILVAMGMQDVKQTLQNGDFPEITGVATMSLALQGVQA